LTVILNPQVFEGGEGSQKVKSGYSE